VRKGFPDGELKLPNHVPIGTKARLWVTDTFKNYYTVVVAGVPTEDNKYEK
jgi:hypothetical protein